MNAQHPSIPAGYFYCPAPAPDEVGPRLDRIEDSLAHLHAKVDRLLALHASDAFAKSLDPNCAHEPGCLGRSCKKCGRQIQAPAPEVG